MPLWQSEDQTCDMEGNLLGPFVDQGVFFVLTCQGATIKRHEITGDITVARVIHGGLADRSGRWNLKQIDT